MISTSPIHGGCLSIPSSGSAPATLTGRAPAEGLGVTLAAVATILLALTALVVHGLVGDRSAPDRRRSALERARAVGQDLRERGEVLPVVVLVVVSLGLWSLVILWLLTR